MAVLKRGVAHLCNAARVAVRLLQAVDIDDADRPVTGLLAELALQIAADLAAHAADVHLRLALQAAGHSPRVASDQGQDDGEGNDGEVDKARRTHRTRPSRSCN